MKPKGIPPKSWFPGVKCPALACIRLNAQDTLKDLRNLVADLDDSASNDEDYETRQESKENFAHYSGAIDALEKIVAIERNMTLSEFQRWMEGEIHDTVMQLRQTAGYISGPAEGWRSYIVRQNLFLDDEERYLELAFMIGRIDRFLELDRDYGLGLNPELVKTAELHATLHS
jgi:hypothetical protein